MGNSSHPTCAKDPGVVVTKCHQCQYGAVSVEADGKRVPILKPTRDMNKPVAMLRWLSKLCRSNQSQ